MAETFYVVRRTGGDMRNKNNVRKNIGNYQTWLDTYEGRDAASGEHLSDFDSPFYVAPVPPGIDDLYETLESLYYGGALKGRQRMIVQALLDGHTKQVDIAKLLGMKQSNVAIELRKIGEKILKKISYNSAV